MENKETHELKVEDAYFKAIKSGNKKFEIRRDDRGFQKGDMLALKRYKGNVYLSPTGATTTQSANAETLNMRITWILTGGQYGLEPGFVAMAISHPPDTAMSDKERGIYNKYSVARTDGRDRPGQDRENSEYFVLDLKHDAYALAALKAYADGCESDYPLLAKDIREKWLETEPS